MFKFVVASTLSATAATDIVLASFDGADQAATRDWRQKNDPVMGGASSGTFTVTDGVGVMNGTVALIPSLQAPGFIKVETADSKQFPDVSTCTGLSLLVRSTSTPSPFDGYRVSFGTDSAFKQCGKFFARGFKGDFNAPVGKFGEVQVPFNKMSNCWDDATGDAIKTCAEDSQFCPTEARLKDLQTMSVWAEGHAADVKLEVKSISAYGCGKAVEASDASRVPLSTFDGEESTSQKWLAVNDPVMGGKSKATFNVDGNVGVFDGATAIVPALQAPGFCGMQSSRTTFPDISKADALELVVRSSIDYKGWRVTIGDGPRNPDSGAPFFVKGSYKANIAIPVSDEFQTLTLPFTEFTYKWSDTTGEPTVKCVDDPSVCPEEKYLKAPKQLEIMAEGVEGPFHLEVKSISAVMQQTNNVVVV